MVTDTPTNPSLLSSIPPELLGEIFTYSSFQQPDAPLVLSAVCSTFHHIVRSTPNAWTRLYLQVSRPDVAGSTFNEHPDERWARKAELWFAMAGVCPVELHVQMDVLAPPSCMQSMREVPTSFSQEHGNNGDRDAHGQWHIQLLPCMLYQYRYRIHGLSLQSTTVDEAQSFFTALYPPQITGHISEDSPLPLKNLTFNASSDGSHRASSLNLAHMRHKHKPATCISLSHCQFANLAHLKFVNHPFPNIINNFSGSDVIPRSPINNAQSLRSLSITYPIRFTPISIYTLLEVLRSAPLLEKLEIEARVADVPSTSLIPTSPPLTPTPLSPSVTPITPNTPLSADYTIPVCSHHLDLITLPNLTSLSLRINNLSALLSHFLLPSLHTLRIDDLDGKRPGAASQTGIVLRQLLVRMELPCEGVQRGPGLQVLDMCGIALAGPVQTHGGEEREIADDTGAVWEWCFRRLRALRELRAAKMDTETLWALITPQSAMEWSIQDEADDKVLPNLRTLSILDYSSLSSSPLASPLRLPQSPSASSSFLFSRSPSPSPFYPTSPMSSSFVHSMSGSLLKFQLRRPEVHVDYRRKHDLNSLPTNADFLDLYGGHRR